MLFSQFEKSGSLQNLTEAVDAIEEALASSILSSRGRQELKLDLSGMLLRRYEVIAVEDDLKRGILTAVEVICALPPDNSFKPRSLNILAHGLLRRYQRNNSEWDLDMAISMLTEALRLNSATDSEFMYLHNLGNTLRIRYERSGSLIDLNNAIEKLRQAVELMPVTSDDRPGFLSDLAHALLRRYEYTGVRVDLDNSIEQSETALICVHMHSPNRPICLNNLGNALSRRSEYTGSMEDLDRAIDLHQEAVSLTDTKGYKLHKYLNSFASSSKYRFSRTGNEADLNTAISAMERALELLSPQNCNWAKYQNTYASLLIERGQRLRKTVDLLKALELYSEIVKETPDIHPNRCMYLSNLGWGYFMWFQCTHQDADLDRAISILQSVADLNSSKDISIQSIDLLHLGYILLEKGKDLTRALAVFVKVLEGDTAPPRHRINAATHAARILYHRDIGVAAKVLKLAIEVLPRISPRTLNYNDRRHVLSNVFGLGTAAAACALHSGESEKDALQLLERGRGILLSLQLETRANSELVYLENRYPALAHEFRALRDMVDSHESQSPVGKESVVTSTTKIRLRQKSAKQFDQLVRRIRQLNGFDRFLLGPSSEDMTQLASEGPIIQFNVDILRSDAFLITTTGIRTRRLPNLQFKDLKTHSDYLRQLQSDPNKISRPTKKLATILKWLWDVAVAPVLDDLGLMVQTDPESVPRVWWVSTGPLAAFPIHAAGYHKKKGDNTMDCVVSSYTVSLKSLAYSRERATTFRSTNPQTAVLVAMPNTPAQSPLPAAEEEINKIDRTLPISITKQVLRNANKAEVIQAVKTSSILHFAGHGRSDPADPAKSCLYLRDGKLFVQDLEALKSQSAQFAYISACQAAVNRSETLLDEAIHLAGTFQLIGYAHVIGSLWKLNDNDCSTVARRVYKALCTADGNIDTSKCALALHHAIRKLRDQKGKKQRLEDALTWAPFVYLGA